MQKEAIEQQMIFRWAALNAARWPELENLIAIPNGGKRNAKEAAMLKAEGVKAGFPDMFLFSPHGWYNGLAIELKVDANKPTEKQKEWLVRLAKAGYFAAVVYGYDAAVEVIEHYLNNRLNDKLSRVLKGEWFVCR